MCVFITGAENKKNPLKKITSLYLSPANCGLMDLTEVLSEDMRPILKELYLGVKPLQLNTDTVKSERKQTFPL